jgi:hypothetical protein
VVVWGVIPAQRVRTNLAQNGPYTSDYFSKLAIKIKLDHETSKLTP